MSPAQMFEHGMARAGYIEVPRDRDLAFEFLPTQWRTIQHYGVEIDGRRHNGPALDAYRSRESPYTRAARGRWPFQVDPDDITRVYAMLEFFAHPGNNGGTASQFATRALDSMTSCEPDC
jgi:hypothetical protein